MADESEGKVSSKNQLTLPSEVRKALHIKPGDTVRYEIEGRSVRVTPIRPDLAAVLDEVLSSHDFAALREQTEDDAVAFVRAQRGLDDER